MSTEPRFQKVYEQIAEVATEVRGLGQDMASMKTDVSDLKTITKENAVEIAKINDRLNKMDDKLDILLERGET